LRENKKGALINLKAKSEREKVQQIESNKRLQCRNERAINGG
jgi:hypothetical protein